MSPARVSRNPPARRQNPRSREAKGGADTAKRRQPPSDSEPMEGETSTEVGGRRRPSPRAFITDSFALHTSVARRARSGAPPALTKLCSSRVK